VTIPKRLARALKRAGSARKLSRQLDVNIFYITQLLRHGIEPTDRTDKGQETRLKLFLPRRKPKPRKERKPLTRIQKTIRKMAKETRALIPNFLKGQS
jgi:hypothetical protein